MKFWQYGWFIAIALIVFFSYATLRETIVGADSAAFIGYSCGHPPIGKGGEPIGMMAYGLPFSSWFFSALPCNMLLFKAIACLNLLLCVLILAKTGELFDKENGWLLGLFVFLNGLFLPLLLDFEEEQLALPFLFAGCYFLLKHVMEKSSLKPVLFDKNLFFGFLFVCFAGLFWKGAIYYVPLFAFYWFPATIILFFLFLFAFDFLLPAIGAVFAGVSELSAGLVENKQVMNESMLGFGFIQQFFLLLGLLNRNGFLWIAIIYTMLLAFMAQRFILLPIPFIGAGLIQWLKTKPGFRMTLILLAIAFLLFSCYNLQNSFPTNKQINAIKEGIKMAKGEPVCNSFGIGWWIKFYSGTTNYYTGFPDCNALVWKGIIIDDNSVVSKFL